jgi:hypothetical protein
VVGLVNHRFASACAIVLALGAVVAAPAGARALICPNVVIYNADGRSIYTNSSRISAAGVSCGIARRLVRRILANDGIPEARPMGFRCRSAKASPSTVCRKGRARVTFRVRGN